MTSSWWANKLNGTPPPPRPTYTPPVQQAAVTIPAQAPAPIHQQVAQAHPGHQQVLDPNRAPNENIPMGEALKLWKGGEAWRVDGHTSCPNCGSHLYFSNTKSRINGASAAPRCYSCGHNGKFEQAEQSNWMT